MHRHRNWLLDSSDWIACSVTHKFNNGTFKNLLFDHQDSTENSSLCNQGLVAWSKDDEGNEDMRQVHKRACKMTGTSWSKCLCFMRQGIEYFQINFYNDDNAMKLTYHGKNSVRKHYSTYLPQLGLCTRSGNLAKEICCIMAWHTNINDADFP